MNENKCIITNTALTNCEDSFALYCLLINPLDFCDISLLFLDRLTFILNIGSRILGSKLPNDEELIKKYCYVFHSFRVLINNMFPLYRFDISKFDPLEQESEIVIIDDTDKVYMTIDSKSFSELAQGILRQNKAMMSNIIIPDEAHEDSEKIVNQVLSAYDS